MSQQNECFPLNKVTVGQITFVVVLSVFLIVQGECGMSVSNWSGAPVTGIFLYKLFLSLNKY